MAPPDHDDALYASSRDRARCAGEHARWIAEATGQRVSTDHVEAAVEFWRLPGDAYDRRLLTVRALRVTTEREGSP